MGAKLEHFQKISNRVKQTSHSGGESKETLTAIVVSGGKLGRLVPAAGAVAGLHLELVPGGLAQLAEEQLSAGVGLQALPGPGALGPEVQHQASDGTTAAGPALQVDAYMRRVDVSEKRLVLVEHGLC